MKRSRRICAIGLLIACLALVPYHPARAQRRPEPGKPIGAVTTTGNLIVMTLDDGALGKANLFDLARRTLRFTPDGTGYRAETLPLQWDSEFGAELTGAQVTLRNFAFPFSGRSWDSLSVETTGSFRFGAADGVSIGRFDQLQEAARTLINTAPAICVFFKPRMSGTRYVKELADRLVITWQLTEPAGGIQDFTWTPTVNRFQAVLRRDGSIDMSYDEVAAKDAIVGLYPMIADATERELAVLSGEEHPAIAAHLDLRKVRVAVVDGIFLRLTIEMRGPVLPEGDPGLAGIE